MRTPKRNPDRAAGFRSHLPPDAHSEQFSIFPLLSKTAGKHVQFILSTKANSFCCVNCGVLATVKSALQKMLSIFFLDFKDHCESHKSDQGQTLASAIEPA